MSHTTRVTAPPVGVGESPRDGTTGGEARPPPVRGHPASLDWAGGRPAPGAVRDRASKPVTAGMVLLAAAAIFEGYRRLDVITASPLHPSALVFAVVAVPAAVLLARAALATGRRPTRLAVDVVSGGLVALTLLETVVNRPWSSWALGAADLLMAAAMLGVAVVSGDFSSM